MSHVGQGGQWSRRRFALVLPLLGALPWAAGAANATHPADTLGPQRISRTLLGTRVDVITDGLPAADLQAASEKALAHMQHLEGLLSRYNDASIVRRITAQAGRAPVPVSAQVMQVLQNAQRVARESAGAFDPTVGALVDTAAGWHFEPGQENAPTAADIAQALPRVGMRDLHLDVAAGTAYLARPGMALDLGGIAKLPILQAALEVLQREGVHNALINGGGDVLVRGQLQGRPWRIGVRDPRQPQQLIGVINAQGTGIVASSGDYERGFMRSGRRLHHVLDPHTGWPTSGVHGVALWCREGDVQAVNGWGTALMVQGMGAVPAWSAQHRSVAVLAAGTDGALWQSPSMALALHKG